MIFSQVEYFYFFVVVFTLHWNSPKKWRIPVLFLASLVFYGTWNYRYVALMLGSTLVDFFAAQRIDAAKSDQARNRWLSASLAANLGTLAVFKYFNFFIGNVALVIEALGLRAHLPFLRALLPIGISFYTFHAMSYTVDVWRGHRKPEKSYLFFFTFVAFFPQLVAGPIVRAGELLDQLKQERTLTAANVQRGAELFFWGLIKKNLFADIVAIKLIDPVFERPGSFDTPTLWLAALGYSLQIYADFSGYTDMARGSALFFGIELPLNFRTPYLSRDITEFWRRWHISLSRWLRDYLYISLGGNRRGAAVTYRNLVITMLLGGLWHGAAWTFVIWGGLHGAALALHRYWSRSAPEALRAAKWRTSGLYAVITASFTFLFVCLAFVIFRAASLADATHFILSLFVPVGGLRLLPTLPALLIAVFALGTVLGAKLNVRDWYDRVPWPLRSAGYAAAVIALFVFTPNAAVPFVYFQF